MTPERGGAGWEDEVVAISDDAGGLVRDQIRALLGRARQRADEIERDARLEAEALQARSRHAAQSVLESIEGIDLGMHERVEELRRAGEGADEGAVPPELIAASEAVHAQADFLRAGLGEQGQESPPGVVAPPTQPQQPAEEGDDLAAQAQRRVAVADDGTLIDMYANAERQGAAGDEEFWVTLKQAVVAEAARREQFAAGLDVGEGLKRGQRKERQRALDAIRLALGERQPESPSDQA